MTNKDNINNDLFVDVKRFFTQKDVNVFDQINWNITRIQIKNSDNEIIFDHDVEHPDFWDYMAVRTCADKYFKISDLENHPHGGERSVKDVIYRVAFTIAKRGFESGYINEEGKDILCDELCYIMLHQIAAFNSPVFFNIGLYDVYGFKGNSKMNRWCISEREGNVIKQDYEYENGQASACFITKLTDELKNGKNGIYDWIENEMVIFANGSGSGVNCSDIRGNGEAITGGGKSSGLISFLKVADTSASSIKSGGKTRRAAKMLMLDDVHPDLMEFISWKANEEYKARSLIMMGYDQLWSSEDGAYRIVQSQNANNSIRVSDEFMNAVINDDDWELFYVTNKKSKCKLRARDIFDNIVKCTWECGDPGLFFKGAAEKWNKVKSTGEIRSTNPCAEYLQPDDTSCNLASLNLIKFLNNDGFWDIEKHQAVVETMILSMEIIVCNSSYPTKRIAERTRDLRALGLGYCNMGGLIMSLGYPYDSDRAKTMISCITSLHTSMAYRMSAKIASVVGPFPFYEQNKNNYLDVIKQHLNYNNELKPRLKFNKFIHTYATDVWNETISLGKKTGFRNSQTVVIAPTGTIQFIMGTTNNGIEPVFSLVSTKLMSDTSSVKLICKETKNALENLNYNQEQIKKIQKYIMEYNTIEGCEDIFPQHIPVFDTAISSEYSQRSITPIAHINAIAAAQPFISGGISKTVNLPSNSTHEDVWNCYILAWKLGCKGLSIYRDGSKWSQPLNSNVKESKERICNEVNRIKERIKKSNIDNNVIQELSRGLLRRKKAPDRAPSERFNFKIGTENIKYHIVRYPDNGISELFIELGKQGGTVTGLVDTIARIISIAIQYGVPINAICETMLDQRYDPAGFIGPNSLDIKSGHSIADLTAKVMTALSDEYKDLDKVEQIKFFEQENKDIKKEKSNDDIAEAQKKGYLTIRCDNCGEYKLRGTMKCGVCDECGHSFGFCSG